MPYRPSDRRRLTAALGLVAALCSAAPLVAEEAGEAPTPAAPGLMERGMELFLEGLMQEMEPTLEEAARLFAEIGPSMQGFLTEMGPALAEIAEQVEDWSAYELPEILPNGDIIIRRKTPLPEDETPDAGEPGAEGSIEL
ncbi:hypothetical protein [Phaeobacter sp. HF9A]|uniref:hypothetical protein n=1 Tax=Phaeobacter sp. HF9A TaxID=2721561 RepID=UPI0014318132|nr:hypothetical protein [Phaeobacter sp. HF9A]NIZ14267.1 hypothetical protein [Phaeobacter sp. HF9A]